MGGGCSTASLLKFQYFAILMIFWKILFDMCIFFYYLHYYQKRFSKTAMQDLSQGVQSCGVTPPPLNEGLALKNPVFCPTSSTDQKHLKLGQCLEIDDRRSLSKFGDVTWPSLHFTDRSVSYRPAFYRLVCKIVNLWDIDLKFLQSISDVNIDNCAKFC